MTTLTTCLFLALAHVPPNAEIGVVAVLFGVPVPMAEAVAHVESGHVPETRRDSVVSLGNVGIFQVNATCWARARRIPRAQAVRDLQNRHTNILAGVSILAGHYARFGHEAPAAFNGGAGGMHGDRARAYLGRVEARMRKYADRRW